MKNISIFVIIIIALFPTSCAPKKATIIITPSIFSAVSQENNLTSPTIRITTTRSPSKTKTPTIMIQKEISIIPLYIPLTDEDYKIYSEIISENSFNMFPGKPLLIKRNTIKVEYSEIGYLSYYDFLNDVDLQMLDNYYAINSYSYKLDYLFTIQKDYLLLENVDTNEKMDEYLQGNPYSEAIISLRRISMNENKDLGFLEIWYYCGDNCAGDVIYLVEKKDGVWRTVNQRLIGAA